MRVSTVKKIDFFADTLSQFSDKMLSEFPDALQFSEKRL